MGAVARREPGTGGIVVDDVTRTFGEVIAVDRLEVSVKPGEIVGLVGPNGAGKTTLLLMLATLLAPDSGRIEIAGVDPVHRPREVRRVMGWMPDDVGTWDALTVREVLLLVAAAFRLSPGDARHRADELLRLVHLHDLGDRPARVLSRGQARRLTLARALVHDPRVLLLDEPAAGLDPRSRIELRDTVRGLAAAGAAVLVSSHVLPDLEELADRAVVIDGGRAIASHDLRGAAAGRRWRITSLDVDRLQSVLRGLDVPHEPVASPDGDWGRRGAVDVHAPDDRDAVALLRALVEQGVPVLGFGPSGDDLESAYLAATANGR